MPEHAAFLADLGRTTGAFRVFRCEPNGKDPVYGEYWKDTASWDRAEVERRWTERPECNIGLSVQPGFLVLDADLYKDGHEAELKRFEDEHGALPATMEFNSARGGIHFIYRTERNLGNGRGTLPDFGDVRGHGGYIVGPGSIFEGKRYTVEHIMPPVALPRAIDQRLQERRSAPPDAKELAPFVMLDDPTNIERFTRWLRHDAKISVEGERGNDTLAHTGAMGSSYGLSWDVTLGLMLDHWNDRCLPPWDDADLEKHGGSGYRGATSKFGNMASKNPRLMFEPVEDEQGWGPRVHTLADLMARPAPKREWAMGTDADGWMPKRDLTLLYGPGGAGKTTLVGQLSLSFARGEPLWGVPVCKMPVLLIAGEDEVEEMHRRYEQQKGTISDAGVRVASFVGEDAVLHPPFRRGEALKSGEDTPFYQFLDYHLTCMGDGDKLLVLDNLGQIYEGDYMDTPQIRTFINYYCRRLARKHNATLLILAHPSDTQKLSGDGGFGGIAWSANVRSRLYFDYIRDGKGRAVSEVRELVRKKANYTREGEGIPLKWDNWSFHRCERPVPPAKKSADPEMSSPSDMAKVKIIADAMLNRLKVVGEGMTTTNLATEVVRHLQMPGMGQTTVETLMKGVHQLDHEVAQYWAPKGRGSWWQYR